MKEYIKPQIEIVLFDVIDIVTTSGENGEDAEYLTLKTMVAGKEAVDYGSQNISVFSE